jgi:hypothetical protein
VYREAVAAGVPGALRELARWLDLELDREADAVAVYREAIAAGDSDALFELALSLMTRQPGREADAEAVYREAAAAGWPYALRALTSLLSDLPGRAEETDRIRRFGLDAYGATADPSPT